LTLNATRPFGNGFLIPAGILREPLTHIRRAQVAVITKSNLVSEDELNSIKQRLLKIKPDMIIYDAIHRPVSFYTAGGDIKRLDYISGKRICAVSALADNTSFVRTLKGLGADIGSEFSYLDHHMYRIDDAEAIVNKSQRAGLEAIVTTQKDWVKLKNLLRAQILTRTELLILKIEIKINNEEDFFNRLYLSIFS
jgi:tetraacyldisaccharide 4'-kinase